VKPGMRLQPSLQLIAAAPSWPRLPKRASEGFEPKRVIDAQRVLHLDHQLKRGVKAVQSRVMRCMLALHGTSHRTQHADPAVLQKRCHLPTILMHAPEAERGIPARIQLQDPVTTRMRRHELSDVVDALLDAEPVAVRV